MYFNMVTREQRAAIVENGKVVEVIVEQPNKKELVHNIYVGKVVNVLPGMQAAFVDIGEKKNGFLYRDNVLAYTLLQEEDQEKKKRNISSFITEGETVIVQVEKEGFGSKGPKLSGI